MTDREPKPEYMERASDVLQSHLDKNGAYISGYTDLHLSIALALEDEAARARRDDHDFAPGCHAGICSAEECVVCSTTTYVTVPVEPTAEMLLAGYDMLVEAGVPVLAYPAVALAFASMCAAAPQPDAGEMGSQKARVLALMARAQDAEATVERLTGELAEARAEIEAVYRNTEDYYDRAEKAEARADRLQAQVERLAEALRPFAECADRDNGGYWSDEDWTMMVYGELPHSVLQCAREALASLSGDGDGPAPPLGGHDEPS